MFQVNRIRNLRAAGVDYAETEQLKRGIQGLRESRQPLFLTWNDLDPIFRWKLRNQYKRVKGHLRRNTDEAFQTVTQAALSIFESDWELEARLRLSALTSLYGVGVPVASAILALTDPQKYCVVDFRGWRAIFGEVRRGFDIPAYLRYLGEIRKLAQELGWSAQETDLAVWEYDRSKNDRLSASA